MKKPLISLLLLILTTLACSGQQTVQNSQPVLSDEQNYATTREVAITQMAPYYLTPESWNVVPQGCYKSMLKLQFYDPSDQDRFNQGSGTLVEKQQLTSTSGQTVWLYHILTANHNIRRDYPADNTLMAGRPIIFPGRYQASDLVFDYINFFQITSNGNPIDIGLVSIFSTIDIHSDSLVPIGLSNVVQLNTSTSINTDSFFVFGYPTLTNEPQFNIATVVAPQTGLSTKATLRLREDFSNVTNGNSGGGICSQSGQLVGVTESTLDNIDELMAEMNPSDIQQQISSAITKANEIMNANGYQ